MSNGWFVQRVSGTGFFCSQIAGRSGACFYTNTADVLANDMFFPEFIQLFVTGPMVEIARVFFNSLGRTGRKASFAFSARFFYRLIGSQVQIGQDRHQAKSRSKIGINKEIVASDPA